MSEKEKKLRIKLANLIYKADWYFGGVEVPEYFMENEEETLSKILALIKYGDENPSKR